MSLFQDEKRLCGEIRAGGPRFWYLDNARGASSSSRGPNGSPVWSPGTITEHRLESDLSFTSDLVRVGPESQLRWARMLMSGGGHWLNNVKDWKERGCEDVPLVEVDMAGYRRYGAIRFEPLSAFMDWGLCIDVEFYPSVPPADIPEMLRPIALFAAWASGCNPVPRRVSVSEMTSFSPLTSFAVAEVAESEIEVHAYLLAAIEEFSGGDRKPMKSPAEWHGKLPTALRAWLDNGYILSESLSALNTDILRFDPPIDYWSLCHGTRNALMVIETLAAGLSPKDAAIVSDDARKMLAKHLNSLTCDEDGPFAGVPDDQVDILKFVKKVAGGLGSAQGQGYPGKVLPLVRPIGRYLGLDESDFPTGRVATRFFGWTRNWLAHGNEEHGPWCRQNLLLTYILAQAAIECRILSMVGLADEPWVEGVWPTGRAGGGQHILGDFARRLQDELVVASK